MTFNKPVTIGECYSLFDIKRMLEQPDQLLSSLGNETILIGDQSWAAANWRVRLDDENELTMRLASGPNGETVVIAKDKNMNGPEIFHPDDEEYNSELGQCALKYAGAPPCCDPEYADEWHGDIETDENLLVLADSIPSRIFVRLAGTVDAIKDFAKTGMPFVADIAEKDGIFELSAKGRHDLLAKHVHYVPDRFSYHAYGGSWCQSLKKYEGEKRTHDGDIFTLNRMKEYLANCMSYIRETKEIIDENPGLAPAVPDIKDAQMMPVMFYAPKYECYLYIGEQGGQKISVIVDKYGGKPTIYNEPPHIALERYIKNLIDPEMEPEKTQIMFTNSLCEV